MNQVEKVVDYYMHNFNSATDFVKENLGIEMEKPEIICGYSSQNNQCIGKRCPFSKVNHRADR